MIKKLFDFVTKSSYRFAVLDRKGFYNSMDDERYLKKKFKAIMGKELNLKNPQTFNEKLQWLKLYNRKDEYTTMVDKVAVRDYIAKKLGEEYLIPSLGVWDNPEDINFDELPDKFVLKCNHNSGLGMCICKDKSKIDIEKVKKELKKGLAQDYYMTGREWPYKNVKPRIIAEKYMADANGNFVDYKFFCFNGFVHSVMVCIDRNIGDTKFYFFDNEWNLLRLNKRGIEAPMDFTLPKPINIERMFEIAAELSEGLPFARIDLYNVDGEIYFGEITFFPDSGLDSNLLKETDELLGKYIELK